MVIKEIIASILLAMAIGGFTFYFIIRPLAAIGDIPKEIEKLRDSVDKLTKEIKYGNNKTNS